MRMQLTALIVLLGTAEAAEVRIPVRYRSAAAVYLSGGSADGLATGDRLSVKANGADVGELEVVFLAEHSASCTVLRETRPIQAGDVALLVRVAPVETIVSDVPPATASAQPPARPAPSAPSLVPWARARGGVSVGWYKLWDATPAAFDFEQRNARLDLGLWDVAGRPLQINVRARGRQDLRARPPGSTFEAVPTNERLDRIYELSTRYEPPEGWLALEAGRVGVSLLGIGALDGAVVEVRPLRTWRVGGFFGERADVDGIVGFRGGTKYGGYLRLSSATPYAPGAYDLAVFGVRETAAADVNREYVGLQGRFAGHGFTFSQWAELDLLRGWREGTEGETSQLSNLSLSASRRFRSGASFSVSYDGRRNYRTAETRSVQDILFDRFLHQGFRASIDLGRAEGLGLSAFAGARLKDQSSDTAYSYGVGLRHMSVFGTHLTTNLDVSGFTNGVTEGLQLGVRVGRTTRTLTTDAGYGASRYTFTAGSVAPRLNQWVRLSVRRDFRTGFWLYGDVQYDAGDDTRGPRASVETGYRF